MPPTIDILLDGTLYAARTWAHIPRVGDTLILKRGEVWAEVEKVVWSDDTACHHVERQWIQLVCKTVEPFKK